MTKRLLSLAVVFTLVLFSFQMIYAQDSTKACCKKVKAEAKTAAIEKMEPNQTKCPVMGNAINKEIFVEHEGQRIFFCCQACADKFKKDPEKYLEKMKKEGVVLEKVGCKEGECSKGEDCCKVAKCCVSGHAVDKEFFIEVEGKKIYFCSEECKEKFEKDPKTYLKTCSSKCSNC